MTRAIIAGSENQSTQVRIINTSGLPVTSVTASTPDFHLYYVRTGETKVEISLTNLGSDGAAHTDGGIIHIESGNYRIDLPDAAGEAGVESVWVLGSGSGLIIIPIEHAITAPPSDETECDDGRTIRIIRGDDYEEVDGRSLSWIKITSINLTTSDITLYIYESEQESDGVELTIDCTVDAINEGYVVSAELTSAQTSSMSKGDHRYEVIAVTSASNTITLVQGTISVVQ